MIDQITGIETTFAGMFEGIEGAGADAALNSIRAVEIPLIQRDYAQGRGTEKIRDIRNTFLLDIRDAISTDQHLSLDFVYGGVTKEGVFRPLDGQQRLTTLFLLHWYLANRSGRHDPTAAWTKFSYDTRPSARRFCELLVKSPPPQGEDWGHLSKWLVDQPWYLYVWHHDPTIASMLVMLDAIHTVFGDLDAEAAFDRLTDSERPAVSFFVLPIEEVGDGDNLYIKMNSRGKPLTDFETFKARFEGVIQPAERASKIAHKFDGAWADVMWPYHGPDNIVDGEFMRYIEFLVDIGEWRTGSRSEGRLLDRAKGLLGGGTTDGSRALDSFESAFDTWAGADIDGFFEGLFRRPGQRPEPGDLRPTLFTPDWLDGVNLFELCCHNYGAMRGEHVRSFPLGLSILLYGVLVHRLEGTEHVLRRLRVLRNLVESSENEIRVERMQDHLAEVEKLMRTGDVEGIKSFNQLQVADELRKAVFASKNPAAVPSLALLEDHRLLRGTLTAVDLQPATIDSRAEAFEKVFADNMHWLSLTGALLACGDYYRRRNAGSFRFGSPTTDSWWRALLTGPAQTPLEQVRETLGQLLDVVSEGNGTLADAYTKITAPWLEAREGASQFDWRYHLVKYPVMREGTSGLYVTGSGEMGYDIGALKRSRAASNYRDPYLLAIYRSLGIDSHRLQDPWFTGSPSNPRWLHLRQTDIALRSVAEGLEIAVPPELTGEVGEILRTVAGVEERPGGFTWFAPQQVIADEHVDTVDRVSVGTRLIQHILQHLDPRHLRVDLPEALHVRAHVLAALIGERLRDDENLQRKWVYMPQDGTGAWVAFELADGRCIELILKPDDDMEITLQVKAYPSYGKLRNLLPGFDHIPLGGEWSAPDTEIVEAFLNHVTTLQELFPRT